MKRAALLLVIAPVVIGLNGSAVDAATAPAARFGDTASSGGYVVTPRLMTSVSSQWVIPRVACSAPNAAVSFAIGLIDGVHGGFTRLGVDVDCHAGIPTYGAYIRLPGGHRASLHERVAAGDRIGASLSAPNGKIRGTMSATGSHDGWYAFISTNGVLHPTSVGILATRVRTPAGESRPLADFGTVRFYHSRLNGTTVTGRAQRLTMRRDDGQRSVKVSPLTRPAGAFSITWLRT